MATDEISEPTADRPRVVVGISGATGVIYGIRVLELMRQLGIETHLVVTKAGDMTRAYETDLSAKELRQLADYSYRETNIGASIASGSFKTIGMIVAPCSVRTLSAIAHGSSDNLLTRAADVTLKERRKLVLMFRETPLHAGHIRSMLAVTEAGAIVAPPVPAFYAKPTDIDDMVHHSVARVLDLFDLEVPAVRRWAGIG